MSDGASSADEYRCLMGQTVPISTGDDGANSIDEYR